jgi:hypothetical protein
MRKTQESFNKKFTEISELKNNLKDNEIEIMISSSKKVAEKVKDSTEKVRKNCKPFEDILDAKYGLEGTPAREEFHKKAKNWYDDEMKKETQSKNMKQEQISTKEFIKEAQQSYNSYMELFKNCKTITDVVNVKWNHTMLISEEKFDKMKNDKFKEFGSPVKVNPFEKCNTAKEIYNIKFDKSNNLTPAEHFEFKCDAFNKLSKIKDDMNIAVDFSEIKDLFETLEIKSKEHKEKGTKIHEKYDEFLKSIGRIGNQKKELFIYDVKTPLKGIWDMIRVDKSIFENLNHKTQPNEFGSINQYPLTDEIKLDCIKAISDVPLILNDIINDCGDLGYAIGKVLDIEDIDNFITGLKSAKTDKK